MTTPQTTPDDSLSLSLRETAVALAENGQTPVKRETALKVAHRIGANKYVECSALTQRGLKAVFEEAVRAALSPALKRKKIFCSLS